MLIDQAAKSPLRQPIKFAHFCRSTATGVPQYSYLALHLIDAEMVKNHIR